MKAFKDQPKNTREFVKDIRVPFIKFISSKATRALLQDYAWQYEIFSNSRNKYHEITDPTKITDPQHNFSLGTVSGMRDVLIKIGLEDAVEAINQHVLDKTPQFDEKD